MTGACGVSTNNLLRMHEDSVHGPLPLSHFHCTPISMQTSLETPDIAMAAKAILPSKHVSPPPPQTPRYKTYSFRLVLGGSQSSPVCALPPLGTDCLLHPYISGSLAAWVLPLLLPTPATATQRVSFFFFNLFTCPPVQRMFVPLLRWS